MIVVPIQPTPKQEFTILLDGILYDLAVRLTNGCMSMDVTRAGATVAQGQRVVAGQPVLPYVYQEGSFGNFCFLTGNNNSDLPSWDQFGQTQTLIFATEAEIGAIRDGGS